MRKAFLSVAAAAALMVPVLAQAPAPAAAPNTWTVDAGHSSAGFSVKHLMVSTVRGTLGPIKGTVEYDGKSVESLKVDVSIDVAGLNTGNASRDRDLKGDGFFDVAQFPTATFKSKRVEAGAPGHFMLIGDLTMHGITKEVTLKVEGPSPVVKAQIRGQMVSASATVTLNRRDFGLQYNEAVEAVPVVADDVQVTIDIEANKK